MNQNEDVSEMMFIPIRMVVSSFNPLEKYAQVKVDHFASVWGENKKYLKALPSDSFRFIRK